MADAQENFRNIIYVRFNELLRKNSSYTLRAFAKKLGIAPSSLSEILNGKRNVTYRFASKVLNNSLFSDDEKEDILYSFDGIKGTGELCELRRNVKLDDEQYKLISEWYYFAIRSLVNTHDFCEDPDWIAKRLNIEAKDAEIALSKMIKLGMLVRNQTGRLIGSGVQYFTSDNVQNRLLQKAHKNNLKLAARSLNQDAVDDRDFTSMTMAIDKKRLPEAKRMIREFRQRISNFLERPKRSEVYKICIQLFPLSTREALDEKNF